MIPPPPSAPTVPVAALPLALAVKAELALTLAAAADWCGEVLPLLDSVAALMGTLAEFTARCSTEDAPMPARLAVAIAHDALGETSRFTGILLACYESARTAVDRAAVLHADGRFFGRRGLWPDAHAHAERALALLVDLGADPRPVAGLRVDLESLWIESRSARRDPLPDVGMDDESVASTDRQADRWRIVLRGRPADRRESSATAHARARLLALAQTGPMTYPLMHAVRETAAGLLAAGDPRAALRLVAGAQRTTERFADRAEVAAALNLLGCIQSALGRPDRALEAHLSAVREAGSSGTGGFEALAEALEQSALLLSTTGDPEQALLYHSRALALRSFLGQIDRLERALGEYRTTLARLVPTAEAALAAVQLRSIEQLERQQVRAALAEAPSVEAAAQLIGMSDRTLLRKRLAFGLPKPSNPRPGRRNKGEPG